MSALSTSLQALLVDLTELHLQAKQLHWNVVGRGFRPLHEQLDAVVDDARRLADVTAERIRAVGGTPDARSAVVAEQTTLSPVEPGEVPVDTALTDVVAALRATVATARRIRDDVDREDPATTDVVHTIILELEQHAWMFAAQK